MYTLETKVHTTDLTRSYFSDHSYVLIIKQYQNQYWRFTANKLDIDEFEWHKIKLILLKFSHSINFIGIDYGSTAIIFFKEWEK